MPFSVGVDIVEIERIRKTLESCPDRFLKKVFSTEEISFCSARVDRIACLAARFAAKEAFKKAVRASVPIAWRDIVVLHESDGGPGIKLRERACHELGGRFTISLSHSRDYAVAVVLWEKP